MIPWPPSERAAKRARASAGSPPVLRWLLAALMALCVAAPSASEARKPRLRLERVDARRCASDGVVRAFVAEVELEGVMRRLAPKSLHLVTDGKASASAPTASTIFAKVRDVPLRLALVIQASLEYSADIATIRAAAARLLGDLPARAKVALLTYGWTAKMRARDATPAAAARELRDVTASSEAGTLALIPALGEAIRWLGAAPAGAGKGRETVSRVGSGTSSGSGTGTGTSRVTTSGFGAGPSDPGSASAAGRRLLVVISNGLNRELSKQAFRSIADQAREAAVTIHPVAYSPTDEREPLINLGEIAKRTFGTVRWAKKRRDLREQVRNLSREINDQLVVTFAVPSRCKEAHSFQVSHGGRRSNAIRVGPQKRSATKAGGPWLTIAIIGGAALLSALVILLARGLRKGGKAS